MKNALLTSLAASVFLPILAHAQLVISTPGAASVVTFDEDVAGIYQARTGTGANRILTEPSAWDRSQFNGNRANTLLPEGVSMRSSNAGASPSGVANDATPFGNDYNLNEATNNGFNQPAVGGLGVRLGGNTVNESNALAIAFDGNFQVVSFFFRIQNNTGAPIDMWNFTFDVLYGDDDSSLSDLVFSYAVSSDSDPDDITFSNFGTAPAIGTTDGLELAGTVNENISATVANGEYIILGFTDTVADGSTVMIDDLAITAVVPEPAHYAAALAAVMGLLCWLRRRG